MVLPPALSRIAENEWRVVASLQGGRYHFSLGEAALTTLRNDFGYDDGDQVPGLLFETLTIVGDAYLPSTPTRSVAVAEDLGTPDDDLVLTEADARLLATHLEQGEYSRQEREALTEHIAGTVLEDAIDIDSLGDRGARVERLQAIAAELERSNDSTSPTADDSNVTGESVESTEPAACDRRDDHVETDTRDDESATGSRNGDDHENDGARTRAPTESTDSSGDTQSEKSTHTFFDTLRGRKRDTADGENTGSSDGDGGKENPDDGDGGGGDPSDDTDVSSDRSNSCHDDAPGVIDFDEEDVTATSVDDLVSSLAADLETAATDRDLRRDAHRLREIDEDVDAIRATLQERYGSPSGGRSVFEVPAVGLVQGHFLLCADYETPEAIASSTPTALCAVRYIGSVTAPVVHEGATELVSDDESRATRLARELEADEEAVATELRKLAGYGVTGAAAESTLRAYFREPDEPTIFDVRGVGTLRGHFLLQAGYDTPQAIADASIEELESVRYLGSDTAPTIYRGAQNLLARLGASTSSPPSEPGSARKPTQSSDSSTERAREHAAETPPALEPAPAVHAGVYPPVLCDLEQWLLWKPTEDGRKIPRAPWATDGALQYVDATDPAHWVSFETAREWAEKLPGDVELAFSLTRDDEVVFVDYDDVRSEDGVVEHSVRDHLERAGSYAAVSTSGTGVHLFLEGALSPEVKAIFGDLAGEESTHEGGSLEVYDRNRFVAMSGRHLEATPRSVTAAPRLLRGFEARYATVTDSKPDQAVSDARKPRSDLESMETTEDIQDVFDAIAHVSPGDISLRSTRTEERTDGTASYDPCWTHSESGTRLGELSDGWVYREGMIGLDALQVVALEDGIITDERTYPSGRRFWTAVDALRTRGARIPTYERSIDSSSVSSDGTADAGALSRIVNRDERVRTWVDPRDVTDRESLALRVGKLLERAGDELSLANRTLERSAHLFVLVHESDLTRGVTPETELAAVVHVASCEAGSPVSVSTVSSAVSDDPSGVRRLVREIATDSTLREELTIDPALSGTLE